MIFTDILRRIYESTFEEVFIKPFARKNANRTIKDHNTIALFCHPRGGSNWLGEILLNINKSILIDEPLWRGFYRSINYAPEIGEGKIKELSRLGFYFDQPIPKEEAWPEAKKVFESILKGQYWNYDIYDKNDLKQLKTAEIYFTKFCYGHLLFNWLHQNFNTKSIVLHRHPCAVVNSQLQHIAFHKIKRDPKGEIPEFRYNEIYQKHKTVFDTVSTREEYLAAIWSLKTKSIHKTITHGKQDIFIFYEDLLSDYATQIGKIQQFLNLRFKDDIFKMELRPSSSANLKHPINHDQQLKKWKSQLSNQQINRILKIVERFKIELYDDSIMPLKQTME